MNVPKMFLVSMILRNAHNCLNGGLAVSYIDLKAPSLETWTLQGPCKWMNLLIMNVL